MPDNRPPADTTKHPADRAVRLRSVVADCLARRSSGEMLPDQAVIQDHPDLMPELGDRLKQLGLAFVARRDAVSAAQMLADGSSNRPGEMGQDDSSPASAAGLRAKLSMLAGYQIIGELSRGGQGVVYKAVQRSTRRLVAIKVLRQNPLGGDDGRARFEREVRVLAQLHHPNIVSVHDSGTVADDLCYFVMDFISGAPLDQYMERRVSHAGLDSPHSISDARKPVRRFSPQGITLREAVRLMQITADAVHAAHLRGIIHRDLKPGNIRVDDSGAPHVLDFGLAKPVESEVSDKGGSSAAGFDDVTLAPNTITGQFLGSMPWASPEQAQGEPGLLDLRTDVYSLGVMFFQVLTGAFPYPVMGRQQDVLNHICQTEPKRPGLLVEGLDADVETIALKCLNKERERRYQSAGEFARDLERYLNGQVIEARRDSMAYVIGKQLRRHRLAVAVAAAFLLVVVAGFGVSAWQWRQAAVQANRATSVSRFLASMLESVNPRNAFDPDVKVRRILDVAADELSSGTHPDEVRAELNLVIGRTYRSLGQFNLAEKHLRVADDLMRSVYGDKSELRAQARSYLGLALMDLRRLSDAEPILRDAVKMSRAVHGGDNAETAVKMSNLGNVLLELKRYDEAESLYRQALDIQRTALDRTDPETAVTLNDLGLVLLNTNRTSEARDMFTEALAILRDRHAGPHSHVAVTLMNLADAEDALGSPDKANGLYEESEKMWRALAGDSHPSLAVVLARLGVQAANSGDAETGARLLTEALTIRRAHLQPDHPLIANTLYKLAQAQSRLPDPSAAETTLNEAIAAYEALPAEYEAQLLRAKNTLAVFARRQQRWDDTERICREILPRVRALAATDPEPLVAVLHNLGHSLMSQDREPEAGPLLAEALQILHTKLPSERGQRALVLAKLGDVMLSQKKPTEAEAYFRELLALHREMKSPAEDMVQVLRNLTTTALQAKRYADAESLARETLAAADALWDKNDMQRSYVTATIGDALRGQGKFAEAEPILLDVYRKLSEPGQSIPLRDHYVAKKIDLLYEEWGRADAAKTWREQMAGSSQPSSPPASVESSTAPAD